MFGKPGHGVVVPHSCELMQRSGDGGEPFYELPVIGTKSQESPYSGDISGSGHLLHRPNFVGVNFYPGLRHNVSQELNSLLTKLTLFRFQLQPCFADPLQDQLEVPKVFPPVLTENDNIV